MSQRLKRAVSAAFVFLMAWLCVFLLVFTSPRRTGTHLSHARVHTGFPHADLFAKRTRFEGALPATSENVGLFHNDLCASPILNDGASSTALMIQPRGVDQESSTASAVTGWRPEAAVQEGRVSRDVGIARELEFCTQCAA